jgi:hypothetical protein
VNSAERILLTLWVGALWGVGYLAVPVLFNELGDRMLAGALAGRMFTLVAYLGLGVGLALAFGELARNRFRPYWRFWLLVAMLLMVAAGQFWLQPMMAALKAGGLPEGSARAMEFGRLHGISAALYLATSLAGLALVAAGGRQQSTEV